jgi:hypothetical protein
MTAAEIAALIGQGRYDLTDEKRCQADIATLLAFAFGPEIAVRREHRLGPYDVPDFLIDGRVVVEVKMASARNGGAVLRQLARYAAYPLVEALILVSNRAIALPGWIEGKPTHFVSLGRAWL